MGRRESERRPKERAASDLRLRVSCHSTPGFIIQRVVVSLTGSSPAWQGIPITPPDTRLPGAHDSSRQNASPETMLSVAWPRRFSSFRTWPAAPGIVVRPLGLGWQLPMRHLRGQLGGNWGYPAGQGIGDSGKDGEIYISALAWT